MLWYTWLLLLITNVSCYNRITKMSFNYNHLDKENIERLERMFYLKNSRYNPMRNRIYMKYLKNETEVDKKMVIMIRLILPIF